MNLFQIDFYAHSLGGMAHVNLLLPAADPAQLAAEGPAAVYRRRPAWPALTLLHGMQGDETSWLRNTRLEQYAREAGMAVILPALGNSYGMDLGMGLNYSAYLKEELPAFLRAALPLSPLPAHNWIAGLSMGGFTALYTALAQPGLWAGAASFSGALLPEEIAARAAALGGCAGGAPLVPPGRLAALAARAQSAAPPLFIACGLQDELTLGMNRRVEAALERAGCTVHYQEWAGGHNWAFWDEALRRFLLWAAAPLGRK